MVVIVDLYPGPGLKCKICHIVVGIHFFRSNGASFTMPNTRPTHHTKHVIYIRPTVGYRIVYCFQVHNGIVFNYTYFARIQSTLPLMRNNYV